MQGLNIVREEIIFKQYLTRQDIREFLRCGWDEARSVFNDCRQKAIENGHDNVKGRAYYKYLLDMYQFKESDIHRMAKLERQIQKEKDALQAEEAASSETTQI